MKLPIETLLAQDQGTGEMPPDWAIEQAAALWAAVVHLPGATPHLGLDPVDGLPVINFFPNPRNKVGLQNLSVGCYPEGYDVCWVQRDAESNLVSFYESGLDVVVATNLISGLFGVTKAGLSVEHQA